MADRSWERLRRQPFAGYVQTYLERDLQALRAVENLADFRRLMRAACLRIGGLLNQTELGRDVGIAQAQVHRFLNLMEASYQAVRLAAFSVNRTRRLIKAPKLYWSDTAPGPNSGSGGAGAAGHRANGYEEQWRRTNSPIRWIASRPSGS